MGWRCRCIVRYVTISLLLSFTFLIITLYWKVSYAPSKDQSGSSTNNNQLLHLESQSRISDTDTRDGKWRTVLDRSHDGLKSLFTTEDDFIKTSRDVQHRLEDVSRLCKKYHLGMYKWGNNSNSFGIKEPPTPLYSYFFWNKEKQIAWCPVYKAGSTSWLQNMMTLAGYSEDEIQKPPKQLSIWAREVYEETDNFPQDELDKSLKLLIVRHPFERLLSAYRDKLSNSSAGQEHGTHHFYEKYGKKIVQKFRDDPSIKQKEPTWEEFIRYILKTDLVHYADDHWLPAYYSCTPCLLNYTIIAKTETYIRDQKYIIKRAGLEGILKPRWSHQTTTDDESGLISRLGLLKQYFGQLKKFQVRKLYEKYKLDFMLFGYDYKDYMNFAKG